LALSEECKESTIKIGFRATGLYPFQKDFVEVNKRLFHMADTLDPEKMVQKMFGANPNIPVCESYKAFKTTSNELRNELEGSRKALQLQFPDLCATLDKLLVTTSNMELPMIEAAAILHLPDTTKVKKAGPQELIS